MNTIRMAFSCTCQPNMNDVQPQMVKARTKFFVVFVLKEWIRSIIEFRLRQFVCTITCHIAWWAISQCRVPSPQRSARMLLLGWWWAAQRARTPAPIRQCSMKSRLTSLSEQSMRIYRPHCTMPKSWAPNMHGIDRVWMETVAKEPSKWWNSFDMNSMFEAPKCELFLTCGMWS